MLKVTQRISRKNADMQKLVRCAFAKGFIIYIQLLIKNNLNWNMKAFAHKD